MCARRGHLAKRQLTAVSRVLAFSLDLWQGGFRVPFRQQFLINPAALFLLSVAAAMEWTPSDKMSTTDLRAVLMSWGVPTLSLEKRELIAQVSKHYKLIMREWVSRMPPRTAIAIASSAAASNGSSDNGVQTPRRW